MQEGLFIRAQVQREQGEQLRKCLLDLCDRKSLIF